MAIVHALAWERSAASVKVSPRSLAVFSAAIVGQIGLVAGVAAVRHHMPAGGVAVLVVFLIAVAGIWLVVSLQLPHSDAPWTALVPGALLYAVGILAVQVFNAYVLGRLLESKASTYGILGGGGCGAARTLPHRAGGRGGGCPERDALRASRHLVDLKLTCRSPG